MIGVLIAGGLGSRLFPLTKVINKHLLPIYDRPMFWFPLQTLIRSGLNDFIIVTSPQDQDKFQEYIKHFDFPSNFTFQFATQASGDRGIADALAAAEPLAQGKDLAVILGDNYFGHNLEFSTEVGNFTSGAHIFLSLVDEQRVKEFGSPIFKNNHGSPIIDIIEKPSEPTNPFAITGLYLLDKNVFSYVKDLKPSARGQLEITDVLKCYLPEKLTYSSLPYIHTWIDCGTFENLMKAGKSREYYLNKLQGTLA